MRHVMSRVIALMVIAAALALPPGGAQAHWTTADGGPEGIGDVIVCQDGISLGWAAVNGTGHRIRRGLSIYQVKPSGSFKKIGHTQNVALFRLKNPILINAVGSDGDTVDYVAFPMLLWPEELEVGTQVIIKGSYLDEPGVFDDIVRDCKLILDEFKRENGRPGPFWSGGVRGYRIVDNRLVVRRGGPLYWDSQDPFRHHQAAWVEFDKIDEDGSEQGLLLMVQSDNRGKPDVRKGAVRVAYDASKDEVHVTIRRSGSEGWDSNGCKNLLPTDGADCKVKVTLNSGEQLRASVNQDDGTVYVMRSPKPGAAGSDKPMRNARLIGVFKFTPFPSWQTGRIGLWFSQDASDAVVNLFGGGDHEDEPGSEMMEETTLEDHNDAKARQWPLPDPPDGADAAWHAIDDVDSTVATTGEGRQAWWEVDLGAIKIIDSVDVFKCTSVCEGRLSNFYIFVSDTPFSSNNLEEVRRQEGVSYKFIRTLPRDFEDCPDFSSCEIAVFNRTGQYVRIQLEDPGRLSLAEVRVWGADFESSNATHEVISD